MLLQRLQRAARLLPGRDGRVPASVATVHTRQRTSSRRSGASLVSRTAATASPPPTPGAPEASEPSTSGSAPQTIYGRPELYESAFSYRNFKEEVRFLQDVYKKHGGGNTLTSVLELGCGTAPHLTGLARAGVPKLVGLDLSPDMLSYARANNVAKLGSKAQAVTLLEADMSEFDLPDRNFDMAMCLLGTFSHILETKQAISAFRSVAEHLRPGGLLVLEMAHPGDLFDGTLIVNDGGKEVWERENGPGGSKLLVEWGNELDNFDPVTQIIFRTVTINVCRGEDVEEALEEVLPQRQYTVRELELLSGMAGLETVALYGEMALEVDLEHEDAYRMVAVYRKPM
ncbi:hypothetical protein GPECTOR_44g25 [Gonium pectorale]|uniref:Methyltransferase domain-containing protein n=1 Tax=Gonium pectorale TaxID=33097 RepID=A0A150G912_GONPE|nr:hypothetical protein GPECTOR_44g25 [Gonium pectorale]|eukprot:KXZ46346.1 hypothetical protein GPECTOR_44g25 [Gonium pectorale]